MVPLALLGVLATLPASRLDVALPDGWVESAVRAAGVDVLAGEGDEVDVSVAPSCAALWQARRAGHTLADEDVHDGWQVQEQDGHVHVWCADRTGFAIAIDEAIPLDAWHGDDLRAALGAARMASPAARDDEVVMLPGTHLLVTLPGDAAVIASDLGSNTDRLEVGGHEATIARFAGDCASAQGATARDDGAASVCATENGVTVVVRAPDAATAQNLLELATVELAPPPVLGDVMTLPHSGWKLAIPTGWTVGEDGEGNDRVGDGIGEMELTIRHPAAACTDLLNDDGGAVYDPAWLPPIWRGRGDRLRQVFCADLPGGSLFVDTGGTVVDRDDLLAMLDSLVTQSSPPPTVTAAGTSSAAGKPAAETSVTTTSGGAPILPFPIDVSLQTLGVGSDRGWGARAGVHVSYPVGPRLALGGGAEASYDSLSHLDYDLGADLTMALTAHLAARGLVGRDQVGTGAMPTLGGAFYTGLGVGATYGRAQASVDYAWRTAPSGADPTLYPPHEWRFRGAYLTANKRIAAWTAEYRRVHDVGTILVGARLRL